MDQKQKTRAEDSCEGSSRVSEETAQRPRRMCFAIETLEMGGAESHAATLAEYLRRRDWQVVFAAMRGGGPLAARCRKAGIEVHEHLMPTRRGFGVIGRLRRLADERRSDTLFVVECFYLNALLAYWRVKRKLGVRTYAIIHNWPSRREFSHPLLLPARVALMNRVFDRVIFIAEGQRRHYEQRLGIRFGRTEVIPSGVDIERFAPADSANAGGSVIGGPTETSRPLRVGIVASFQPRKGHEDFFRAAAAILRRRRDVEFLVVGDGPRRDGLLQLAHDLNIAPHVRFLGVRDDVPDLLRSLDVVVLSSKTVAGGHAETLPLVLMEAGAVGLPVVATDVGAVSDIVVHEQTGFLVPEGDTKALAEKTELLLSDPPLRARMGALARQRVVARFAASQMCRRFEQLFLGSR